MTRKPSPATLIACTALFFSLGGAGLAAVTATHTKTKVIQAKVTWVDRACGMPSKDCAGGPATGSAIAMCPAGMAATGGGYNASAGPEDYKVASDQPWDKTGWLVSIANYDTSSRVPFQPWVVCAS